MKKDILKFFKEDRSYNGGVSLYMRYGNRASFRKQLNLQPETRELKEMLYEELRSLAEIDHRQFQVLMRAPVVKEPAIVIQEEPVDPLEIPVISEVMEEPASPREKKSIKPKKRG
jgi:hypothetical protein